MADGIVDRTRLKSALRTPNAAATKKWSKLPPGALPSSVGKTKSLVRLGVPFDSRGAVWMRLSGGDELLKSHPSCYEDALAAVFENGKGADNPRAPMFGSRTDLSRLYLTEEGVRHASRILCAVAYENPVVEFCPFLPVLVVVFLHHMKPAEAYACISSIVKSDGRCFFHHRRPSSSTASHKDANAIRARHSSAGFLITSHKELNVAAEVLRGLVSAKLPGVYAHILSMSPDTSQRSRFFDDWIDWIFECLPFDTLERVLDCMLFEGKKILFRIGVGLIKIAEPGIVRATATGGAIAAVCNVAEGVTGERLLEAGFSVSLSRKDISHLYDKLADDARPVDGVGRTDLFQRPLPSLSAPSEIVNDAQLEQIWAWVPVRFRSGAMKRLYSMTADGSSARTLYTRCGSAEPLIFIVKAVDGKVLGAYVSRALDQRTADGRQGAFFGTAEMYVFAFSSDYGQRFEWVGASASLNSSGQAEQLFDMPDFFVHASDHYIGIGGQKNLSVSERKHHALWLDVGLGKAASFPNETFRNPPLHNSAEGGEFEMAALEIYTVVDSLS